MNLHTEVWYPSLQNGKSEYSLELGEEGLLYGKLWSCGCKLYRFCIMNESETVAISIQR